MSPARLTTRERTLALATIVAVSRPSRALSDIVALTAVYFTTRSQLKF